MDDYVSSPGRDWIAELMNALWSLTPASEETKAVTRWMQRPDVLVRLKNLAVETGEKDDIDAFLEAVEMELDAGEIPALQDKEGRHQISWAHVTQQAKKLLK